MQTIWLTMHLFQLKQNSTPSNNLIINKLHNYTNKKNRHFYYLFRKNDSRTKLKTIFVRLQYDIKDHE